MIKISVIIPNFNNGLWLQMCLESVLLQKGEFKKEIIVVDDHSTDESWDILHDFQKKYPKEVFIYRNPSKGGNSARNFGFSKSSGEYIQWLDSDDSLLEGKFSSQLQTFYEEPSTDIVFSDWRMDFYNEEGELFQQEIVYRNRFLDFTSILLHNILWNVPNTYLMKREICHLCVINNGWSESTKVGQDREFFTLAAILGARFSYCKGIFSVYNRWSKQSVSKKYKEKEIAKETLKLNNRFFKLISESNLSKKRMYQDILNAELLNVLYHQPALRIHRRFMPWRVNLSGLNWKLKMISPLIYFYHLFKQESK